MKITHVEETSLVGKQVFFNAQELIALAGLVQELDNVLNSKENRKQDWMSTTTKQLFVSTHTLLSPITEGVKSLDETFKDLFIPKDEQAIAAKLEEIINQHR